METTAAGLLVRKLNKCLFCKMNYTPQVCVMKKLLSITYNKCQEKAKEWKIN